MSPLEVSTPTAKISKQGGGGMNDFTSTSQHNSTLVTSLIEANEAERESVTGGNNFVENYDQRVLFLAPEERADKG